MSDLTAKQVFRAWYPLAGTWLLIALEGPMLQALIARLPDATQNLAAFGVGLAAVIALESPIFMILTTSAALVDSRPVYERLRNFTVALSLSLGAVLLVMLSPPFYPALTRRALALAPEVADLTWQVVLLLCGAPFFVAYRRLYQGILIRSRRSGLVALGTLLRLASIAAAALALARLDLLAGAPSAALALAFGFTVEALYARAAAQRAVSALPADSPADDAEEPLSYREIAAFFLPLALNSAITTAIFPTLTFFMGRAPGALESLAVYPVINNLNFIFICAIFAMQEVVVGLMDKDRRRFAVLQRFFCGLSLALLTLLSLAVFSPASDYALSVLLGLPEELRLLARAPLRICLLITLTGAAAIWQRSILILARRTRAVTAAGAAELAAVVVLMLALRRAGDLTGIMQGMLALLGARGLALAALYRSYRTLN